MINTNASASALNHGHHQKVTRPEAKDPRPEAKDLRPEAKDLRPVAEPTAATAVPTPTDATTRAAPTLPTEEFSPVRGKSIAHQVRAAFAELGEDVVLDKPFGQYVSQQARFGSIEALLPTPVEEPASAEESVTGTDAAFTDSSESAAGPAVADSSDLDTSETDDSVAAEVSVATDLDVDDTVSSAEIAAELLDDVVDSAVDEVTDALT